jgi:hypothetical protein
MMLGERCDKCPGEPLGAAEQPVAESLHDDCHAALGASTRRPPGSFRDTLPVHLVGESSAAVGLSN